MFAPNSRNGTLVGLGQCQGVDKKWTPFTEIWQ
jgi:hypothetical protein